MYLAVHESVLVQLAASDTHSANGFYTCSTDTLNPFHRMSTLTCSPLDEHDEDLCRMPPHLYVTTMLSKLQKMHVMSFIIPV